MRLSQYLPEAIPGPAAVLYGLVVGNLGRPALVRVIMRGILGVHGFSGTDWETHVPDLVQRSRFRTGRIEPLGMYRRVELMKDGKP